jgi:hypothetical protein
MNNELELLWREADVAWFEVLFYHLRSGAEENCVSLLKLEGGVSRIQGKKGAASTNLIKALIL